MSDIKLNIDKGGNISEKEFAKDIELLRDFITTLSEEYNSKANKLDDRFSQVKLQVRALAKAFEDIKSDFSKSDHNNLSYLEQTKGFYNRATEQNLIIKNHYEDILNRLNKIEHVINSSINPFNSVDIGNESFESLVMRVSKVIQKISEIENQLNESKSIKYLSKFKKLFSNAWVK